MAISRGLSPAFCLPANKSAPCKGPITLLAECSGLQSVEDCLLEKSHFLDERGNVYAFRQMCKWW